jgi:polysaccharide biosynthesis transport protein
MNPENHMPQPGASIGVGDVVYILFRHKWKIVLFTLLGLATVPVIWKKKQPLFESEAKILVRYVSERRAVATGAGESDIVREPEARGLSVINSEVEILSSADCVLEAVRAVGASKILEAYGGGTNEYQAAGVLLKKLNPKVGSSGVVTVVLGHPDPEIAREALTRLIEAYRRKHVRIHRATEAYDDLQAEADRIRIRLAASEADLRLEKKKVNVISLEDAKAEITAQLTSLRSSIFATEAELAETRAELELAEKSFGVPAVTNTGTNSAQTAEVEYPAEKVAEYRLLSAKLNQLKNRESELLLGNYAETSRVVEQVRLQIAETEQAVKNLAIDPARLTSIGRAPLSPGGAISSAPENDFNSLRARTRGLEAKAEQFKKQRAEIQAHFAEIEGSENRITELERLRTTDEAKLRQYETNLEKARLDQAIDSNKITNISVVQEPTPAGRDMMKLYKIIGMGFFGMIGAGIALSFATEMFLDGSLKRAKDVEQKSRIPLFVSIPYLGKNGGTRRKLIKNGAAVNGNGNGNGLARRGEIAPWDMADPMFDYYEAIRDRLVMSYEGDPHKPKIVAVTSCNKGAGTSRIATGLAASLSRDVQRHVLYIGLEKNKVAVTSFFKGRPGPEATTGVDEMRSGDEVLPPDLYTLARVGHGPEGASIVQTFCDMIPKLRMSEYDYIIFDLPPVSETSGALRLASQMERTLLIVESEETQKAKVDRVRDLLAESSSRMFAVLNKTKTYGPKFLQQDS